ncbi:glycosyltransferase family 2 protein [Lutispora sp.]|uniref:glycosyltransferase family 2 protein n=1 Tax=Lutispora sp. TaxID=2828727 RepID=UPI0035621153
MKERYLENECSAKEPSAVHVYKPKISIITQHYNINEHYIRRAIESIMNQTFTDFEYIISDNASTDNTAVILDEYAAKDDRIKVIHRKETLSRETTQYIVMNLVKGEYIAFLDNDDYYEPNFLEEMYRLAVKTDADLVACGTEMYKENDIQQRGIRNYKDIHIDNYKNISDIFVDIVWVAFATYWCKLFKTRIVKDMHIEDVFRDFESRNDTMFCLAYAQRSNSLAITSKVLHHYCIRSNSTVRKWANKHLFWADGTYTIFKRCLENWNADTATNINFISIVFLGNIDRILQNILNDDCADIGKVFSLLCNIVNDHILYEVIHNISSDTKILDKIVYVGTDMLSKISSQEERYRIQDNFLYKLCKMIYTITNKSNVSEYGLTDYLDALYSEDNKFKFGKQYLLQVAGAYNKDMYIILKSCDLSFILEQKDFIYSVLKGKEQYPIIMSFLEQKILQRYYIIANNILNKNYKAALEGINQYLETETDSRSRLVLLETACTINALEQNAEGYIRAAKLKANELIDSGDYENAATLVLDLEEMLPGDEDVLYYRLKLLVGANYYEAAQKLADEIYKDTGYTVGLKKKIRGLLQ